MRKSHEKIKHDVYCSYIVSQSSVFKKKKIPSTRTQRAGVFKLLHFEEIFENPDFRDGLILVRTVGEISDFKLRFKIRDSVDATYKVVLSRFISFRLCLTYEVMK